MYNRQSGSQNGDKQGKGWESKNVQSAIVLTQELHTKIMLRRD